MKYAVYVVIVEDTDENDIDILTRGPAEEGERLAGDMTFEEAEAVIKDVRMDYA